MQQIGAQTEAPKVTAEVVGTTTTTQHPRDAIPSSGENSRCESDEEYRSPTVQPNVQNAASQNSRGVSGATSSPMSISTPSTAEITSLLQRHNAAAGADTSTPLNATNATEASSGRGYVEMPASSSYMATHHEERMRRKLQFFFMNPIEKWQARRKFPYKFVVQVSKCLFIL